MTFRLSAESRSVSADSDTWLQPQFREAREDAQGCHPEKASLPTSARPREAPINGVCLGPLKGHAVEHGRRPRQKSTRRARDEIGSHGMFSTTNLGGDFSPSGVSQFFASRNSFKHAIASDFVHDSIDHVKRPCEKAANLVQSRRTSLC